MHTDTILEKDRSLGILSYVFLLFYDRDKSKIVDETNVVTWGTWTGDLSEFGTHARPDVALLCHTKFSKMWFCIMKTTVI